MPVKSENLVMEPNSLPAATDIQNAINSTSRKLRNKKEKFLDAIINRFISPEIVQIELSEEEKLIVALKEAHNDWLIAKVNFKLVCDNDLIDQAIYNIAAAEKRYQFLLKQAKQENLSVEFENIDLNRYRTKYTENSM